jgi:DNA-binding beta-propeller fold protein YncE
LYATNSNNSILAFNNASTANRNAIPTIISGPATTLSAPGGIHVDTATDRLYAANPGNNSVVVFNNASTAIGEIAPDRTILDSGAPLAAPAGVFADVARDLLYVADLTDSISIFEYASTLKHSPPPVARTILPASGTACSDIATTKTDLCSPRGISVDTLNDQLYTANSGASSILIFNDAGSIATNGMVLPGRTILPASGTACGDAGTSKMDLCAPFGVAVDAVNDRLYVANTSASSILVFENANSIATDGMVLPGRTILSASGVVCGDSGTTRTDLCAPFGVAVDAVNDRLYVANTAASSILVFENAGSIATNGMVVPDRTILPASGTACGDSATTKMDLCSPGNVFVDTVNDRLYVANTSANSILVFDNASSLIGNVSPSRVIAKGTNPDDNTTLNMPFGIFIDTTR